VLIARGQERGTARSTARPAARALARSKPGRPCRSGAIALTFDDGPSPVLTSRLVRILLREDVPATFFMVGSKVRRSPQTARLVESSGFTIGNHTFSHRELTRLSGVQVRRQVLKAGAELRRAGIATGPLMRPPYGAINGRVRREIRKTGLVPVLWTADSMDWSGGSALRIAHRILTQLRPYRENVVLQHDGVGNSAASIAAVPIVIHAARARGYCFTDLAPDGGLARVRSAYARAIDRALARKGAAGKAGSTKAPLPKPSPARRLAPAPAPPAPSPSPLLDLIAQVGSVRQWTTPPLWAGLQLRSLTLP